MMSWTREVLFRKRFLDVVLEENRADGAKNVKSFPNIPGQKMMWIRCSFFKKGMGLPYQKKMYFCRLFQNQMLCQKFYKKYNPLLPTN